MLGMSLLLGARGIGAVVGPLFSARWAGQSDRRLQLGILLGYLTIGVGYFGLGWSPNIWMACVFIVLAHCGGSTVWVFSTTHPAVEHGRPFPRPRLLRRPGFLHADHCDWCLRVRDFSRSRSVGAGGGVSNRDHHAAAGATVGMGDEVGPGNHVGRAALGCPPERSSAIGLLLSVAIGTLLPSFARPGQPRAAVPTWSI